VIQAICFDVDGVLIDSTSWHREAFAEAVLLLAGAHLPEGFADRYEGATTQSKLLALKSADLVREKHFEPIAKLKHELVLGRIEESAQPDPRVLELFCSLEEAGYALAIASNLDKATLCQLARRMLWDSCGRPVLSREDVAKPKPAGDVYREVCARLNLPARDVLVVEDSETGIAAAVDAGCAICRVESPAETAVERLLPAIGFYDGTLSRLHRWEASRGDRRAG